MNALGRFATGAAGIILCVAAAMWLAGCPGDKGPSGPSAGASAPQAAAPSPAKTYELCVNDATMMSWAASSAPACARRRLRTRTHSATAWTARNCRAIASGPQSCDTRARTFPKAIITWALSCWCRGRATLAQAKISPIRWKSITTMRRRPGRATPSRYGRRMRRRRHAISRKCASAGRCTSKAATCSAWRIWAGAQWSSGRRGCTATSPRARSANWGRRGAALAIAAFTPTGARPSAAMKKSRSPSR